MTQSASSSWFPVLAAPAPVVGERAKGRGLSEADAVDIWIARWLRIRPVDLCRRYGCDPRRLYEIWEGIRHPAARDKAKILFLDSYPSLSDRIDFGRHRRLPREIHPDQLPLFD